MKRLTLTVERDEDALAIVQLLIEGTSASRTYDFRLETLNNGTPPKRRPRTRAGGGRTALVWEEVLHINGPFGTKQVMPLCALKGMARTSASALISQWVREGKIERTGTGPDGVPLYLVKAQ